MATTTPTHQPTGPSRKKPEWLKVRMPASDKYFEIKRRLRGLKLHTVCEEAQCPNIGECWASGTATIMLMGDTCTRGCRFCAVTSGKPTFLDPDEPENVAKAIAAMGISYVVLTSVDRDDLPDGGARHIGKTIRSLRHHQPDLHIETLVPDFQGDENAIDAMLEDAPDVFAHNIETVERTTRILRDARCGYRLSLDVLRYVKTTYPDLYTKTSIMLGLGETPDEVEQAMRDCLDAGVDFLTIGQYLRPSRKHLAVQEYIMPDQFKHYKDLGTELGFKYVASGPLVRSSYRAGEHFIQSLLEQRRNGSPATPSQPKD